MLNVSCEHYKMRIYMAGCEKFNSKNYRKYFRKKGLVHFLSFNEVQSVKVD